jgi:hypothetical protein
MRAEIAGTATTRHIQGSTPNMGMDGLRRKVWLTENLAAGNEPL